MTVSDSFFTCSYSMVIRSCRFEIVGLLLTDQDYLQLCTRATIDEMSMPHLLIE
jgi:hypothetical protein